MMAGVTVRNDDRNNTGSNVQTVHNVNTQPVPSATLRLRAAAVEEHHVQWADDVVDNEGMGKKSSKGAANGSPITKLMRLLTTDYIFLSLSSMLHISQTASLW